MIPKLFWWTNQPTLIEVLYNDSHFSRCDRLVKSSYVFYFWARVMERYKGQRSGSTFAIWVSLKIGDTPIGWDMYTLNEPFQTEFRQMKDKFFFRDSPWIMASKWRPEGSCSHVITVILIDIWANDVDAPDVTRTLRYCGIATLPCFFF